MLKSIGRSLLWLLFPSHCELCSRPIDASENAGVCEKCAADVAFIPGPHCQACGRTTFSKGQRCGVCGDDSFHFDRAFACVPYEEGMKELLHRFKFGKKRFLTPFFAATMAQFCQDHLGQPTFDVIPVPMDKKRRLKRGFNQSELLARRLAESLERPYLPGALDCAPAKKTQSFLKKDERKQNVRDRFFVKKKANVRDREVLLVDDILTTGSTASACAKALKDAGARSVTVLAFARGI